MITGEASRPFWPARPLTALALAGALSLAFLTACRPKSSPDPQPAVVEAVNRGVSQMGHYDYEAAVTSFEEALRQTPDLPDVKVNLAIARFNRGKKEHRDVEEAAGLLEAVLQKQPGHLRALYFKAIVLQHQGQADAAIPCLEQVLSQRPDDGVAWYLLGLCRQRAGQDAQKDLLRAVELRPYLSSAYYKLWQTFQAAGETERAAPFLEKFKQLREHPLAETIEFPQYNQMGELALVTPLGGPSAAAVQAFSYTPARSVRLWEGTSAKSEVTSAAATPVTSFGGAALADLNRDGRAEAILSGWSAPGMMAFKSDSAGDLPLAPFSPGGLDAAGSVVTCAIGDYDNDETPDLFVVGTRANQLLRGSIDGSFSIVPGPWSAAPSGGRTRSALWLDADHDGDLDLLLCNAGTPHQLFNNNSDGSFSEIASASGFGKAAGDAVRALPGDLDGDRDTDLLVFRESGPAIIFHNDLFGKFAEAPGQTAVMHGDLGGVLQDFNGDGLLDVLALGKDSGLRLFVGDGQGQFASSDSFSQDARAVLARDPARAVRAADIDLDGDLDIALFGREGHVLLNEGHGRFAAKSGVWKAADGREIRGAEIADLTGDLIPDALLLEHGATDQITLRLGAVSPTPSAIAVAPSGVRSRDKRTRSPASGYGVGLTVRTGVRQQSRLVTGLNGGMNQSPLPVVFGLGGAKHADYVQFHWPDGVAQVEAKLAAGRIHSIAESQRKVSSCPVLFTWNGSRFEFITDFAGVGGLGYFAAPGEYANPQPVDHVKIEPHQLTPRHGHYEVRITEPMEETAYVDRLELLAIDHPADWLVFPDERLTVGGPPPTRELLVLEKALYPVRAVGPDGLDCTENLKAADRHYAFEPVLDRRFCGFSRRHALELDFGDQLAALPPGGRVFLFINGYLEYPYSQTTYAAGQAGLGWEPIRVEKQLPDGHWETVVPDAGALGGMSRTMTIDLTGLVPGAACRLRLSSNLEIFYDQIFLGAPVPRDRVTVHAMPVATADLRYVGFAREVSPDGRQPLIYDYAQTDPTAPFRTLSGSYTRYGPVRELLDAEDDQFVLVGSGDEIAASFDATTLPAVPNGFLRSFVLVSHAYCKDMDLYTATPQTLEPMPFRGMSRYPYPESERPAESAESRRVRALYNTRIVE